MKQPRNMKILAELTGLTFDGGPDDNRLFTENNNAETLHLNKKEYNLMEKRLNNFKIKGHGFSVSAWNDSSGYQYWTKNMKENNYIQITVYVEADNALSIDLAELRDAIDNIENEFSEYRDYNYYEFHSFPKNTSFFNFDANVDQLESIED